MVLILSGTLLNLETGIQWKIIILLGLILTSCIHKCLTRCLSYNLEVGSTPLTNIFKLLSLSLSKCPCKWMQAIYIKNCFLCHLSRMKSQELSMTSSVYVEQLAVLRKSLLLRYLSFCRNMHNSPLKSERFKNLWLSKIKKSSRP